MRSSHPKGIRGLPLILCLLLVVVVTAIVPALAQPVPIPVSIGTPQVGEVSATDPAPRFSFTVDTAQSVTVQVLAVIPGFVPSFNIYDPSGTLLQAVANTAGTGIVETALELAAPGAYVVEVSSVTGAPGTFIMSVIGTPPATSGQPQPPAQQPTEAQAAPPAAPPAAAGTTPLFVGAVLPGSVTLQAPMQLYTFGASPTDVLVLTVRSDAPTSGQTVSLRNTTTGVIIATSGPQLIAARYSIPAAPGGAVIGYQVEVSHGGSAGPESYIICLEPENDQKACPGASSSTGGGGGGTVPVPAPAATENVSAPPPPVNPPAACTITANQNVNVRSGPHVNFNVVETLFSGSSTPAIGRTADNAWYQISVDNRLGWVAAAVVSVQGDCSTVPVVAAPPPPAPPAPPAPAATATTSTVATEPVSPPKGGEGQPTEEAQSTEESSSDTEPQPNETDEP